MKKMKTRGIFFVILGAVMAVITFLIINSAFGHGGMPGFVYMSLVLTIPLVANGIAYFLYTYFNSVTQAENSSILPIVCGVITLISGITGFISLVNDHSFMFKGWTAQLIWFFISIPCLVLTIIHFVIFFVKICKKNKMLEKQS